jgi:hypothetical protein
MKNFREILEKSPEQSQVDVNVFILGTHLIPTMDEEEKIIEQQIENNSNEVLKEYYEGESS